MSFIALGVATIRAEERRCSRELWPQFGECQDNKLFRLRRRSRSRQGKQGSRRNSRPRLASRSEASVSRSEEHTSELQSRLHLVCRLLLEKKKNNVRSLRV